MPCAWNKDKKERASRDLTTAVDFLKVNALLLQKFSLLRGLLDHHQLITFRSHTWIAKNYIPPFFSNNIPAFKCQGKTS